MPANIPAMKYREPKRNLVNLFGSLLVGAIFFIPMLLGIIYKFLTDTKHGKAILFGLLCSVPFWARWFYLTWKH